MKYISISISYLGFVVDGDFASEKQETVLADHRGIANVHFARANLRIKHTSIHSRMSIEIHLINFYENDKIPIFYRKLNYLFKEDEPRAVELSREKIHRSRVDKHPFPLPGVELELLPFHLVLHRS